MMSSSSTTLSPGTGMGLARPKSAPHVGGWGALSASPAQATPANNVLPSSGVPSGAASVPSASLGQRGTVSSIVKPKRADADGIARRREIREAAEKAKANTLGAKSKDGFHALLKRKYGNTVRGWRLGLDTDGSGKLSYMEFCTACRAMGYEGAIKKLWTELDEDSTGWVSLDEMDSHAAQELGEFRGLLEERFKTVEAAWREGLDTDGSGVLTFTEFKEACRSLGFTGSAKRVFQYLDLDVWGTGQITMDEIDFLGLPHEEEKEDRRQQLERERTMQKAKTMGAKCVNGFKTLLKRKFGNVVRGWRLGLDNDGNGRLSYMEFCTAVRGLGYEGAIKALWHSLDTDKTGWVSLDELVPGAARELRIFRGLLEKKYSDIETAWRRGLDLDGSGGMRLDEFEEACSRIGYTGDARRLFQYLDVDIHGTGRITIDELEWLGLPHSAEVPNTNSTTPTKTGGPPQWARSDPFVGWHEWL